MIPMREQGGGKREGIEPPRAGLLAPAGFLKPHLEFLPGFGGERGNNLRGSH
mgnify:CR=1 FL=1